MSDSTNENGKIDRLISKSDKHEILENLLSKDYLSELNERQIQNVEQNNILNAEKKEFLRAVPSETVNLTICSALSQKYGDKLSDVGCFTQTESNGYKLDVGRSYEKTGIIAPIFEGEFITGLKIYRSVRDEKPFVLRQQTDGEQSEKLSSDASKKQTAKILQLLDGIELFHNLRDDCFAILPVDDHVENHKITRNGAFRQWLSRQFYLSEREMPSTQSLNESLENLRGRALFESPCFETHVRVAEQDGITYIDLGNKDWEAVRVTKSSWEIVSSKDIPVKFRRPRGMLALPTPEKDGDLEELKKFVNLDARHFIVFVAWLINCFRPNRPFPIAVLTGEFGSSKSTTCEVGRALVDPNESPLRSLPNKERDLAIAANNGWMQCYDNLSGLSAIVSDSLCRLSTGGGLATRELYTDSEESLFNSKRPILLNGIDNFATRPDFLDRSLILNCLTILEEMRKTKEEFENEFNKVKGQLFGAILDKLCEGLRELPGVKIEKLPRMADFAKFGVALFGDEFLEFYTEMRSESNEAALESSSIGALILEFMKKQRRWEGTAKQLLNVFEHFASQQEQRSKYFPKQPNTLSKELKRIIPNLRMNGINVERGEGRERRKIILLNMRFGSSPSSLSAQGDKNQGEKVSNREQTYGTGDYLETNLFKGWHQIEEEERLERESADKVTIDEKAIGTPELFDNQYRDGNDNGDDESNGHSNESQNDFEHKYDDEIPF